MPSHQDPKKPPKPEARRKREDTPKVTAEPKEAKPKTVYTDWAMI